MRSFCVCLSPSFFVFLSVFFCVGCVKEEVKKRNLMSVLLLKKKAGKKKKEKRKKIRSFVLSRYKGILLE